MLNPTKRNANTFRERLHVKHTTGLTLLELLVVLTILIALSGIVVATLPGLLKQTQTATAAANVPEIDAAIKRNMLLNSGRIGDRFDSLVDSSGQIASYLGGQQIFQSFGLAENDVFALAEIGLTEVVPAAVSTQNATFQSHVDLPVSISADTKICAISNESLPDLAKQLWNIEPVTGDTYLVFGIGQQTTLVGAGPFALFAEAPLHFSDSNFSSPEKMYSRYFVVVRIARNEDSDRSRASYIGIAIPGQAGLEGMSGQLEEYYSQKN